LESVGRFAPSLAVLSLLRANDATKRLITTIPTFLSQIQEP